MPCGDGRNLDPDGCALAEELSSLTAEIQACARDGFECWAVSTCEGAVFFTLVFILGLLVCCQQIILHGTIHFRRSIAAFSMGWNEEALYDLSEMPGVKRSISNWLRLVFKSRRMPFSWMGSRDSWRYAHVEYKHYPFAKVCRAPFCTIQADMEFNAGLGFPGEGHGEGYGDFHYLALWSYGFSFDEAPGGLFGIYSFFHYSNLWLVAACLLWMSGGLFDKYLPSGLRQADYQNFRQLLLGFLAGNALKHPHAMHSEPLKALGLFPLEWTSDGMNFSRQDFLWVFPAREGFPMALGNRGLTRPGEGKFGSYM